MKGVVVTGIGLVSSLGAGRAAHAAALRGGVAPAVDEALIAPHPVHPLPPGLGMEQAMPRREWRQMETWQRLGTFAAGLCLDDAGARGLVADMDLVLAAGGGERDLALDGHILAAEADESARNRMMADGLRPTLFLAQLSNLLAGSVSIVHGVGGSSRTLIGDESAGAEALRVAWARVAAGTSAVVLAGAAYVGERADLALHLAAGEALHRGAWRPVAERKGAVLGSAAAFLLFEEEAHARDRGAAPLARVARVATDQGAPAGRLERLAALRGGAPWQISAASGAVLGEAAASAPARFAADLLGHTADAAFPAAFALAALAVAGGAASAEAFGCGIFAGEFAARLERAS